MNYAVYYTPPADKRDTRIQHLTADGYARDGDLIVFRVGTRPVFSIKSESLVRIEERGAA
jgi:hypothetical protein